MIFGVSFNVAGSDDDGGKIQLAAEYACLIFALSEGENDAFEIIGKGFGFFIVRITFDDGKTETFRRESILECLKAAVVSRGRLRAGKNGRLWFRQRMQCLKDNPQAAELAAEFMKAFLSTA